MENLPRSTVATKDVLYLVINRVRKVSSYFGGHWANSHHEHNTFAAIKGGLNQGGEKMKNWARARPKIKFLKNVPKIFYRWPLT